MKTKVFRVFFDIKKNGKWNSASVDYEAESKDEAKELFLEDEESSEVRNIVVWNMSE